MAHNPPAYLHSHTRERITFFTSLPQWVSHLGNARPPTDGVSLRRKNNLPKRGKQLYVNIAANLIPHVSHAEINSNYTVYKTLLFRCSCEGISINLLSGIWFNQCFHFCHGLLKNVSLTVIISYCWSNTVSIERQHPHGSINDLIRYDH